ncbi:MAG: glucose-6-phosphate dehydrogenase, partial [Elusimicrobiales bacterium]|nr:glucose-6-phosphate dehydrogenase [Elusimicrobiales bacterium]
MTAGASKASREALCLTETVPDPCAIVIFGASGDLARRKLIPSVFHLHSTGALPSGYRIVGVGRTPLSDEDFRESMRGALPAGAPAGKTADFLARLSYLGGDIQSPEFYSGLKRRLAELSREHGLKGRLFYLSTPPSAYPAIGERLEEAGLAADAPGAWSRIVIEKPFGYDLASARALNALVHKCFREEQVYRIDHYLGKETVQNLLMFRFANALFEPAWNRNHIDHVQITSSETLGVEHRAGYYDRAGVLRDMFQNHLTQLLAMIA